MFPKNPIKAPSGIGLWYVLITYTTYIQWSWFPLLKCWKDGFGKSKKDEKRNNWETEKPWYVHSVTIVCMLRLFGVCCRLIWDSRYWTSLMRWWMETMERKRLTILWEQVSEWVSEWVCGWVSGWVSEWVTVCVSEWVCEWVGGWVDEWVSEWVCEWVSECVCEWVCEWVGGWVSEWVSEWLMLSLFQRTMQLMMTIQLVRTTST